MPTRELEVLYRLADVLAAEIVVGELGEPFFPRQANRLPLHRLGDPVVQATASHGGQSGEQGLSDQRVREGVARSNDGLDQPGGLGLLDGFEKLIRS